MPDTPVSVEWKITNLQSWTDLKEKLAKPYKCIGLAGLPGTGKTDLMVEACKGILAPSWDLMPGFVMRAPANADYSEIARQLVLSLCSFVSGEEAGSRVRGISADRAGKGAFISSIAAVIAGSVLLGLSAAGVRINAQVDLASVVLLAGVVGLLAWFMAHVGRSVGWFASRRPAGGASQDGLTFSSGLRKRAAELADTLEAERRFETTVTSGWAGGLTASGVEIGSTGSVAKKLLPMPLYELAKCYRELVAAVAGERCLLIGIDGLDRRGPGADIDQVLYDLKVFLQAEGCRYLITMAENSGSRTLFRPGIIDVIVRCEFLPFPDAREFIIARIPGVSEAVAALCFTASAALPGELVKMTYFVDMSDDRSDLESICRELVKNELVTLCAELRSAARALPSWARQQQLFNWANQLSDGPLKADWILAVADDIRAVAIDKAEMASGDDFRLRLITHRAAALAYFYATLIDFFKASLDPEILKSALGAKAKEALSPGRLATARRLIDLAACGPAWNDIYAFRVAWGMPVAPTANDSASPRPHHLDPD
jgi:hypothetical protein